MSSVIYTNTASLVAQKNLLGAQNALATSVERLSSGLRINRARDDAAGLSVANSLQTQINGANQGIRNMNDAISMVQTAEGAIAAASDMGQRILTLATQGANGTLGKTEKEAIVTEMKALLSSISKIGERTNYSSNSLLNFGAEAESTDIAFSMQISNTSTDTISLSQTAFRNIGIDNGTGADQVLGLAQILQDAVDELSARVSAGTPTDLNDVAVGNNVVGGGVLAADTDDYGDWIGQTMWANVQDEASAYVNSLLAQRSELGAYQNQMEYTLANITELSANLSASKSRVIDTDYASETAALTRGQILQQAATAMLAQANQMPNVILTLLK
jgi:flagellin